MPTDLNEISEESFLSQLGGSPSGYDNRFFEFKQDLPGIDKAKSDQIIYTESIADYTAVLIKYPLIRL